MDIEINFRRMIRWILAGMATAGLAFWMVVSPEFPGAASIETVVFVCAALATSVGSFWMMYVAIRYETKPLSFVLVSFLPFSFVWYYFERVRPNKRAPAEAFPHR